MADMQVQLRFVVTQGVHIYPDGDKIHFLNLGMDPGQSHLKIHGRTGRGQFPLRIDKKAGPFTVQGVYGISKGGHGIVPDDGEGANLAEKGISLHLPVFHECTGSLFKAGIIKQQGNDTIPPGVVIKVVDRPALGARLILLPYPDMLEPESEKQLYIGTEYLREEGGFVSRDKFQYGYGLLWFSGLNIFSLQLSCQCKPKYDYGIA